jgi:molybdenum cofactor cytidylyltransferase
VTARVSAIVLAAGLSTRMSAQKALLPWHGVPLLAYQLRELASLADVSEIIVVTGHDAPALAAIIAAEPKARAAHNPAYQSGKAGSVLAGLRALDAAVDAILLCAVDQPREAAVLRRLLDAHDAHDASGVAISVPAHAGRRGHPVVFARTLLPELLAIDEATQGARAVVARDPARVQEVPFDDPAVLADLNTPDDLRHAT